MHRTAPALALALVGASALIAQPSLTPPAGPIEESGRFGTLIELSQESTPGDADSVFRITQPGSYVLTSEIDVPTGEIGIELASNDITLDLNGYTLRGESRFNNVGVGVSRATEGNATIRNIVVRNGMVTNLDNGILVDDRFVNFPNPSLVSAAREIRIEGITVSDTNNGIRAAEADIIDCIVDARQEGILNPVGSVDGCRVIMMPNSSSAFGVRVTDGRVTDTAVEFQTNGPSSTAFIVDNSIVRGCRALTRGDFSTGFAYGTQGASVTDCVARRLLGNNTVGFNGDGATTNSTAVGYFIGFASDDGVIRGCAAIDCTTDVDPAPGVALDGNNF